MTPEKIDEWFDRFRFYRHSPSREDIEVWLKRFDTEDRPMAAKLLDEVKLISEAEIQQGYRDALNSIPGWHRTKSQRAGKWVIAGFGGQGESGAAMLRPFREANGLSARSFDYLFCSPAELPSKQLTEEDTVIFVDDFSGTGDQIVDDWGEHAELSTGARAFLILTAATRRAIERILTLDYLDQLLVASVLEEGDDIFAAASNLLTAPEKAAALNYCKKADKRNPQGYGRCGLLLVLSHKTPNNSLPILHVTKHSWAGLFPRYLPV